MIFVALMFIAVVAIASVALDAWQAERVIARARQEWDRDPVPWWLPRD